MMIYTNEKLEELQKRWESPKGERLIKLIKKSRCYLNPILFRKKVNRFQGINDEEVRDGIDLRGIKLSGFDFRIQVKDENSDELIVLSNIHFEGAILKHCTFEDGNVHDCFFENADLSHTHFKSATLNSCNFQESNLQGASLTGAKIINCSFVDANFKDVSTASTIIDQKSTFGKYLKSEKEENFHFASIEYKQIKEMYKHSSLHDFADQFHHMEMKAKRKLLPATSPARWMNYIFGDLLCKYGTSFLRVAIASAIIVVACAGLYTINDSLAYANGPAQDPSFGTSLYFSMVTFATVGYGDYHALGEMRYLAAFEGFMGAALMALFTVIVARQIIRD